MTSGPTDVRFRSVYATAAGVRLHALVSPDPPPGATDVVLVHALAGTSGGMMRLGRRLAASHRVWAVDMPGHGRSEPAGGFDVDRLGAVLAAWLRDRVLHRPALVAASFGCQVAIEVAVREPALLDRLVLVGPTVERGTRSTLGFGARLAVDVTREPMIFPAVIQGALRNGPRVLLATLRAMADDPTDQKLRAVEPPTLVVRGGRDPFLHAAAARQAVATLPRGRLVELPGLSHVPHFSHPDAFVAAVAPFLANGGEVSQNGRDA
jgi:pimeloyl-ACP methyl ester carboxylesterase